MTKPGKIYKDPDAWVWKWAVGITLVMLVIGGGILGLVIWAIVELIQLFGRLG